jgi:hypothetical protein
MFADPQTVTVNSVAKVMARYLVDGTKANYQTADGLFILTISHQVSKGRTRSMVRVDQKAIVTNPLDSTNDYDTLSFYSVLDRPDFGFTTAQAEQLVAGCQAWLTAANVDKLLGRES